MAKVVKPLQRVRAGNSIPCIFMAGSIEMGTAENWQSRLEKELEGEEVILLNPRRDDWDASWVQSIDDPQFRNQVEWELNGLEAADLIIMYFSPETKSPISMLEFGLFAKSKKLLVYCAEGFWRKGNVDVVCARYKIPTASSPKDFTEKAKLRIRKIRKGKKLKIGKLY